MRPGPGPQRSTQARTQRGVPGGWLIWGGLWKLLTQLCTHPNPPGAGPLSPASGRGSGSSPLPALFPADVLSGLQFSSVAQSCPTLCDPLDRSTPGLPVHHQFPESTQTHVHWISDAISFSAVPFSSWPQSFPTSGSFLMSQLFASGDQSIGASASVLLMNIPLGWTGWISLQSKGLSRVFSHTTVQKHQFFGPQLSLWSNSHTHT